MATHFCTECGTPVEPGILYCGHCGHALPLTDTAQPPPDRPTGHGRAGSTTRIVVAVVVVVGLVVVIGGALAWRSHSEQVAAEAARQQAATEVAAAAAAQAQATADVGTKVCTQFWVVTTKAQDTSTTTVEVFADLHEIYTASKAGPPAISAAAAKFQSVYAINSQFQQAWNGMIDACTAAGHPIPK